MCQELQFYGGKHSPRAAPPTVEVTESQLSSNGNGTKLLGLRWDWSDNTIYVETPPMKPRTTKREASELARTVPL